MNPDVRFACGLFLLDIVMIFSLRSVLNDFLLGNCSKRGVRNIRQNLTFRDRVTMEYISQYIREEKEKKSFRRHRLFYVIKCFAAPVLFAGTLLCAITGFRYIKVVLLLYLSYVLIPELIIGLFEWDPRQKCTVHAMKTHPYKQRNKQPRDKENA